MSTCVCACVCVCVCVNRLWWLCPWGSWLNSHFPWFNPLLFVQNSTSKLSLTKDVPPQLVVFRGVSGRTDILGQQNRWKPVRFHLDHVKIWLVGIEPAYSTCHQILILNWWNSMTIHLFLSKLFTYIYIYIYIHICMSVCLSVCLYVCMYVRMHACMHVCMYAYSMYACMHVCMFVRIYIFRCMAFFLLVEILFWSFQVKKVGMKWNPNSQSGGIWICRNEDSRDKMASATWGWQKLVSLRA